MKKVRLMAVLMSAAIMAASFVGCKKADVSNNNSNTNNTGAQEAPMEISIANWDIEPMMASVENDQFIKDLEKKLNIKIKPVNITWDDYTQKIQMWAAADQLPDIFSIDAVGTQYYRKWVTQGVVKALPSDLSKYPTLAKYLDKPDIQALKENGKLYTVPRSLYDSLDYCAHDRNVFYRWDLAQQAGITKEPETWDEFNAMIKAIEEKDPEKKGIGGMTAVNVKQIGGFLWLYSNPAATSDGSGADFKWIKEDGKFIPAVMSTKLAMPSLQNARKMYEEGVIDKDIAMIKGDQGYDKFATGKSAALLEVNYANINNKLEPKWKAAYSDKKMTDCIKRVKYFPATDGQSYHATFKTFWSESYISSKVDDKKLDKIMQLYDYMLQGDTKEFYRFGVKGVDYTKDGDKINIITKPEDLLKKQSGAISQLVEFDNAFQYDPNNFTMNPDILKMAQDDLAYAKANSKMPEFEGRLTALSTPTKDKFAILDADFMLNIMMGKESVDKMWSDNLREYEAKGLSKMIEEVNAKAKELGIN